MTFTVTYRDKTGAMREKRVEAASHSEAVAALKAQGIVPIRVEAISGAEAPGRRARNGDSAVSRRSAAYVLAVAFVILVGGGLWWWLGGVRGEPALPPEKPKTAAIYKEADGAGTTASRVVPAPSPSPVSHIPSKTKSMDTSPTVPVPSDVSPANVITNHGGSQPHPFRSGTEQVMGWIFMCPVGSMPPLLPTLPEEDLKNIEKILDSPNLVGRDDTDHVADAKQTVDYAKTELRRFLEDGGRVEDFLRYYHGVLVRAHVQREDARNEYERMAKEDTTMAEQFRVEANKMLSAKGIVPLAKIDGEDEEDVSSSGTDENSDAAYRKTSELKEGK